MAYTRDRRSGTAVHKKKTRKSSQATHQDVGYESEDKGYESEYKNYESEDKDYDADISEEDSDFGRALASQFATLQPFFGKRSRAPEKPSSGSNEVLRVDSDANDDLLAVDAKRQRGVCLKN